MKGKRIAFIFFEVFVIILGITGVTLAVNKIVRDRASVGVKVGDFYVDYKGNKEIEVNDLEPIDDSLINIDTHDNVIRMDFSLRGMESNPIDNIIYDVIMDDMNIDCSFLNEYTKWNLYKNGNLLSSGNLSPSFDGSINSKYFKLTNIQEDLPKHNESYDNYTFILWISESCKDLNTCTFVDQSDIVNSKISFRVFVALYTGSKVENVRKPNYDNSCANSPELYGNMIPISYKNGNIIMVDEDNSDKNNIWYDYNSKIWANAVVTQKNNYSLGDIISKDDILAYYVWIPKYSYKVWNIDGEIGYQAYDAYKEGIDIKFSNGTITCNNYKCNGDNLDYYTNPAFDNVRGFWVSKYELSSDLKFIPNFRVTTNSDVTYFENEFNNIKPKYVFDYSIDSSIINSYEWGAITYLTHSKYGNMNISMNNSYISGNNSLDSTTGNIYGVFDMSGGASEFVKVNSGLGSATKEISIDEYTTWDNNYYSENAYNNYYVRGGVSKGIYSYGSFDESSPLISTRNILKEKSSS